MNAIDELAEQNILMEIFSNNHKILSRIKKFTNDFKN